jgi:hypothetical protein
VVGEKAGMTLSEAIPWHAKFEWGQYEVPSFEVGGGYTATGIY